MLEAVPARVVGRVAEAEVGPEVDDRGAVGDERRHLGGGRAVGEGQEDGVGRRQAGVDEQLGRGEVRVEVADRLVVAVAPGEADDLDVRVAAQEADQLRADVAGRADDPDAQPTRTVVTEAAAQRARQDPGRAVRRDRGGRLEPRAHGRMKPFADGWLGWFAGIGWTVVMGRMTIQNGCIVMQGRSPAQP